MTASVRPLPLEKNRRMLLSSSDPDWTEVGAFESWDADFSRDFDKQMKPYGWKYESHHRHEPPVQWQILQEKSHPFFYAYHCGQWNPVYHLYFQHRQVGTIDVDVHEWSTHYRCEIDHEAIMALPLVEELPFDDLVQSTIKDFLARGVHHV